MEKSVVLLSGGLDSAVTLYYACRRDYRPLALVFGYGQRHKKEIDCARKLARLRGAEFRLVGIDLSWAESAIVGRKIKVPAGRRDSQKIPVTYVSGRNIIFLSYACSLAESIGARRVFIGAHTQDYSGYPDCRPEFIEKFQSAVRAGLKKKNIIISTPLINKDKAEIIKLGLKLGVPFEYTWSCYRGGRKPCRVCDSCRFRMEAFNKLGIKDPIL